VKLEFLLAVKGEVTQHLKILQKIKEVLRCDKAFVVNLSLLLCLSYSKLIFSYCIENNGEQSEVELQPKFLLDGQMGKGK
jgi:hypothetical protein